MPEKKLDYNNFKKQVRKLFKKAYYYAFDFLGVIFMLSELLYYIYIVIYEVPMGVHLMAYTVNCYFGFSNNKYLSDLDNSEKIVNKNLSAI